MPRSQRLEFGMTTQGRALRPAQRLELLQRFRRLLTTDGALLFDVHTPALMATRSESLKVMSNPGGGFWSPADYFEIHATHLYLEARVSLDLYTIVEEGRTWRVHNWLQYFDRAQIQQDLQDAGYCVEAAYADVCGTPLDETSLDMAIIARPN